MPLTKATYSMIQGACSNAWDFLTPAQIVDVQAGTLSLDVTSALQAWITAIGTGNYEGTITGTRYGYLPAGEYRVTSTLVIPANTTIYGVPANSVLRPGSTFTAGTPVLDVRAGVNLYGIVVDGVDAVDINGYAIPNSESTLSNNTLIERCWAARLTRTGASGGIGFYVQTGVGNTFRDCWGTGCLFGALIKNVSQPAFSTIQVFEECNFIENEIGAYVVSGHQVDFNSCLFEANTQNGLYLNSASVANAIDNVVCTNCWFENNWTSKSGAARNAEYDVEVIGANYFTARQCEMSQTGPAGPKSFHFELGSLNFVLDNNTYNFFNYNTITIDSGCTGIINNWPSDKNYVNYVNAISGSTVKNVVGQRFVSFSPQVTFSTPGDLSVSYTTQVGTASYNSGLLVLNISLDFTPTFTTASDELIISNLSADMTAFTQAGQVWEGSMYFANITKASYTQFTPVIASGENTIKIRASGSGQALDYVKAANITSGASTKLFITMTSRIATI
jgi:hypothetical protein